MLDKLSALFSSSKDDASDSTDESAPLEVSFAALLVEAACADENYDDHEKALIDRLIGSKFDLDADASAALRNEAETAQDRAVDIQRFTRHAKEMPLAERIDFVENLWEVILSDGERDSYEDALVRRICGLIYVEDRASGEARARVEARRRE